MVPVHLHLRVVLPTAYFIPLLVDFINDLDLRRIILKEWTEYEGISRSDDSLICRGGCERNKKDNAEYSEFLLSITQVCVRITDDISLLNWIPFFAMLFLNKMRIGRRWRKPVGGHLERKFGFIKLEKKVSGHS